jgi:predicted hydrolase (HD superfamily)
MEKLTREQAHEILMKYMKGENYIQHSYAVEAIMRGLAKKLAPECFMIWMRSIATGKIIRQCMGRPLWRF